MRLNVFSGVLLFCAVSTGLMAMASDDVDVVDKPHVVFLMSEEPNNYEAHKTIPVFAKMLHDRYGCRCTVLQGEGEPGSFRFPGLKAIETADLLVMFFRRRALPDEQLAMIHAHLAAGKPLVGIRTANHAFSVTGSVAEGHGKWWEFVPDVLGCGNHGYGSARLGADVNIVPEAAKHPILSGIAFEKWHSNGCLYFVAPIDKKATVLLRGSVEGKTEPIAWTRKYNASRVFYTSLGYPDDFKESQFRALLVNAVFWAMDKPVPAGPGR